MHQNAPTEVSVKESFPGVILNHYGLPSEYTSSMARGRVPRHKRLGYWKFHALRPPTNRLAWAP